MSESRYSYADSQICCGGCGLSIGQYVTVGRETWLQIGVVKLFAVHGCCTNCDAAYHFSASEKTLERIIERHKRRKNAV